MDAGPDLGDRRIPDRAGQARGRGGTPSVRPGLPRRPGPEPHVDRGHQRPRRRARPPRRPARRRQDARGAPHRPRIGPRSAGGRHRVPGHGPGHRTRQPTPHRGRRHRHRRHADPQRRQPDNRAIPRARARPGRAPGTHDGPRRALRRRATTRRLVHRGRPAPDDPERPGNDRRIGPMIRLLLADDEHLIRTALAALLGMEDDLDVIAQAASGPEAVAMARLHHPDVAVLDLQMPGLDGITVAEQLHTQLPDCATLIVTSHGRPGHLKRALAAGVGGFLPKTVSGQVLADVVRTVHAGGRYVDPQLAAEAISTGDNPLTSRETDVLELAANGTPIEDIARQAALSPGTVRNYLSSAATKLGAANRHEAAQRARTHGWI